MAGLENVVAASSGISFVDGKKNPGVLTYRGYKIQELVKNSSFEESAFLILNNKLPTDSELKDFSKKLISQRELPKKLVKMIKKIPKDSDVMDVLRTSISLLALYENKRDKEAVISLIAKFPTVVAYWYRIKNKKRVIKPNSDLNHTANFLNMIKRPIKYSNVLNKWLILHLDHTFNASTFAGRVTCSTLSDIYSGVVSCIGTLKGSLHGGANQKVIEMLLKIKTKENVKGYIEELLDKKEKIMGFGHRVYKKRDPRAVILRSLSKELCIGVNSDLYEVSEDIERLVYKKIKKYPNVDFYSASVLYNLKIPVSLFTAVFAISRVVGWCAHIQEQHSDNKLIRPIQRYVGEKNKRYVDIKRR